MKNYKEQNSCMCCKHVFVKDDYDEGVSYYCHQDKSERPICGSVAMKESFFYDYSSETPKFINVSDNEYEKKYNAWEEWSNKRIVSENGICDYYEK